MVEVVRAQRVEEEMGCPRYLIWATGKDAVRLSQEPAKPLPFQQLIFRYSKNDILVWLLANHGQDPLNPLVVESRSKNIEDGAQLPGPGKGRYRFVNCNVCEDAVVIMQPDEDEDEDQDQNEDEDKEEEEWLEAESEGETQAPRYGGRLFWTTLVSTSNFDLKIKTQWLINNIERGIGGSGPLNSIEGYPMRDRGQPER